MFMMHSHFYPQGMNISVINKPIQNSSEFTKCSINSTDAKHDDIQPLTCWVYNKTAAAKSKLIND